MVIGHHPTDYDFATNARPSAVMKLFKSVIPTGIKHGTVTVLFEGHQFEVTTFRVEGAYSNARHPDKITFTGSLYEDLKRRDFTINSMAIPVLDGTLIDPHEGCRDLKRGLIRAIGEPAERFREDGLRLMRACRFSAQLEFSIEAATKLAMRETVETIRLVSAERI
ncbi:MAG: CCA tRNA nucleotidyltransferase, partial [Sediminispirochaetaceae bacterium]